MKKTEIVIITLLILALVFFCYIMVKPPKEGKEFQINDKVLILEEGNFQEIKYSSNKTLEIVWESSDENIVAIDEATGYLIAKQAGETTITAKSKIDNTVLDVYEVKVVKPAIMKLDSNDITLIIGESKEINVIFENWRIDENITWSSDNNDVALVNDGVITAKGVGNAIITAKASDGKTDSCNVKVLKEKIEVNNISLPETFDIGEGESKQLQLVFDPEDATDKTIEWKSQDSKIVSVDENGNIKGISLGESEIIATSSNGKIAKVKVTVHSLVPTIDSCLVKVTYNSVSKTYDTTYTLETTSYSKIDHYVHNNVTYNTSPFTVANDVEDDVVMVYNQAGNSSSIRCDYQEISVSSGIVPLGSYNSSTLKYWIEEKNNDVNGKKYHYYLTHIWVKDSYKQFGVSINTSLKVDKMLTRVKSINNWDKKGLIAINASGYNTTTFILSGKIVINGGNIIRPYDGSNGLVYGMKENGYIKGYTFSGDDSKKQDLYDTMVNVDKVAYTTAFSPILLTNYVIPNFSDTSPNFRQALCQVDRNNFIIVSNYYGRGDMWTSGLTSNERSKGFNYPDMASLMLSYNCRHGINLDGGRSVNLYYKDNSQNLNKIIYSSRNVGGALYFIEQ